MDESISIIVPVYNEEAGIIKLKNELKPVIEKLSIEHKVELILVDDGSTDNSYNLLKEAFPENKNTKIIRHEKNMNLGAALRTGFKNASGSLIFCLDSDCTYSPEIIFDLLKKMKETNADIVTVSPYHPKGKVENIPFYRLILSKGISFIYAFLLGSKIKTFTAMVRLYKRKVIETIKFESNDFLSVTELIVYSLLKGFKVEEVPATLKTRTHGSSKIKILSIILKHLKLIAKIIILKIKKRLSKWRLQLLLAQDQK